jgi:phasin family protein
MQQTFDAFAAVNKAGFDSMLAAAQVAMNAAEQFSRLQLEAGKSLLKESLDHAKEVAGAESLQGAGMLQLEWGKSGLDKFAGYARNCIDIAKGVQGELAQLSEKNAGLLNREWVESVEKALTHTPVPGGDLAMAAMKSVITANTTLMDSTNHLLKQVHDFTEAGLKSAAAAVDDGKEAPARAR